MADISLLDLTGGITVIVAVGISVWSFLQTRKRYYKEFLKRRKGGHDEDLGN